jgi:hypothetical protein
MPFARIEPVIDTSVRGLCCRPYPRHPKGCPNFGQAERCPPKVGLLPDLFDLTKPCFAVWNVFNLAAHVDRMRLEHPKWSKAQLECCLYWQGGARKQLFHECEAFQRVYGEYKTEWCPEAMGLNVTETMRRIGIGLEWPPVTKTFQVAFAGIRRIDNA